MENEEANKPEENEEQEQKPEEKKIETREVSLVIPANMPDQHLQTCMGIGNSAIQQIQNGNCVVFFPNGKQLGQMVCVIKSAQDTKSLLELVTTINRANYHADLTALQNPMNAISTQAESNKMKRQKLQMEKGKIGGTPGIIVP